jgi:indole-3-glycerol phosphate synthase
MLERFRQAKAEEIESLRRSRERGDLPQPAPRQRPGFAAHLQSGQGPCIIAEYKRGSPSKGLINDRIQPEEAAGLFADSGAAAISVLTEASSFQGSMDFLQRMSRVGLPLLRKDFIFDPLQVEDTARTPASALLLIARYFHEEPGRLTELLRIASHFGLEPVVEIFDAADLDAARRAEARIIQVNNRDLDSLEVSLETSKALAPQKRPDELWISASGISARQEVEAMGRLGFDACLIGTSIMSHADPGKLLRQLTGR